MLLIRPNLDSKLCLLPVPVLIFNFQVRRLKNIPESLRPMQLKSSESSPETSKRSAPTASSSSRSSSDSSSSKNTSEMSSSSSTPGGAGTKAVTKLTSSSELVSSKPSASSKASRFKSVFSRLGGQETNQEQADQKPDFQSIQVELKGIVHKKPPVVKKEEYSSGSDEEYGPRPPVSKKEKDEKPSIFDRLEKVEQSQNFSL